MDDILWLALSLVKGIGIKKLISLNKALAAHEQLDSSIVRNILGDKLFRQLNQPGFIEGMVNEAKNYLDSYREKGISIIAYTNLLYPQLLRNIPDPPVLLYCRGNIEALNVLKKVAVIGTRWPTEKGREAAEQIATAFAKRNWVIVSGLASGIDTAAHIGTLRACGITIAVLPGSFDNIYPRENRGLAEQILESGGLLLTEYPSGIELQKRFFVERDRIQSGLSLGACVVQTEVTGGAMHTASFCRQYGRPVFIPEPSECLGLKQYSGNVKLMEEGVTMLENEPAGYERVERMMHDIVLDEEGKVNNENCRNN